MKRALSLDPAGNLSTANILAIAISITAAYMGLFSGHKSFSKELILFLLFLNGLDLAFVLGSGKGFSDYRRSMISFLQSPRFIGVDIFPAWFMAEFIYGPLLKGFFLELIAFLATYVVVRFVRLTLISSLPTKG